MQPLQTHAAIHHQAHHHHPDPNLRQLIAQRIGELTDHTEDLADLILIHIHILILEPSDTLTSVDVQLGFPLGERPIDAIESHPGCPCWWRLRCRCPFGHNPSE
jgi:hypothetical protein